MANDQVSRRKYVQDYRIDPDAEKKYLRLPNGQEIKDAATEAECILWDALEAACSQTVAPGEWTSRDDGWAHCLSIHWLHAIQCNHEAKTDESLCVCGWRSTAQPTVGLAVAEWIIHVQRQMGVAAPPAVSTPRCPKCGNSMEEYFDEDGEWIDGAWKVTKYQVSCASLNRHFFELPAQWKIADFAQFFQPASQPSPEGESKP